MDDVKVRCPKGYPQIKTSIDGRVKIYLSPDVILCLTAILGDGTTEKTMKISAEEFIKRYPELCANALKAQEYMAKVQESKESCPFKVGVHYLPW